MSHLPNVDNLNEEISISYTIYETEWIMVMLLLFDYLFKNLLNKDFKICKRQDILHKLESFSDEKFQKILTNKKFQTITKKLFIFVLNKLKYDISYFENLEKKYVQKKTDDRTPSFLIKLFQNEFSQYMLKEQSLPVPVPVTRTKTRAFDFSNKELDSICFCFPHIQHALNTFLKNEIDNFFSFRKKVDFMKEFGPKFVFFSILFGSVYLCLKIY